MQSALATALVAIALGATACSDQAEPPATSAAPATQATPPAAASADAPPAPTPSTHAGGPAPEAPAAATAKDTPANNPQGELTRSEENTAMPKAGQANNHSSPAFDPSKAEPKS
jgi:hypothetical protein